MNSLFVFHSGMAVAFVNGAQVPELQCDSLFALWAEMAEHKGYDPAGFVIETQSGNWRLERVPEEERAISNGWRAVPEIHRAANNTHPNSGPVTKPGAPSFH